MNILSTFTQCTFLSPPFFFFFFLTYKTIQALFFPVQFLRILTPPPHPHLEPGQIWWLNRPVYRGGIGLSALTKSLQSRFLTRMIPVLLILKYLLCSDDQFNNMVLFSIFCSRSKWKTNPYTCGSYSYIPIGASAEDVETMSEPVADSADKVKYIVACHSLRGSKLLERCRWPGGGWGGVELI